MKPFSQQIAFLKGWLTPPAFDPENPEAAEARYWGRTGIAVVAVASVIIGVWAVWAPLHGAVIGHGLLKVENYRQIVQHQEGGIVKAIQVQNGSPVRKGDPLIVLEDLRIDATYDILSQQHLSELAKHARLAAERELRAKIDFPAKLLAEVERPAIGEVVAKEKTLFAQRRQSLQFQIDLLNQQILETEREIRATEEEIRASTAATKLMQQEMESNQRLLTQGFISNARLYGLQRNVSEYQMKLGEQQADLSRAKQKQNDLRLKIEAVRNDYRDSAARELKESTDRLNELEQRLVPAADQARRQTVTAPVDGVVVDLKVHTVGATVAPRDALMDIVPSNQKLVVEAKLPLDSISELRPGMRADVRLTAYKRRTTPLVEGVLTYLSADALTDRSGPSGETYYLSQITLDPESLKHAGIETLQAGMPAEVYIQTRARSALEYLLDPVLDSLNKSFREK